MPKLKTEPEENIVGDKPAASLLKSWGKRLSQGNAPVIPVYVGGAWSFQVPRGNKRVLQVFVNPKKN